MALRSPAARIGLPRPKKRLGAAALTGPPEGHNLAGQAVRFGVCRPSKGFQRQTYFGHAK